MSSLPCGIWILEKIGCCSKLNYNTNARNTAFRWLVFVLTFVTYSAFHASRKPISVVKNVLNQDCQGKTPPPGVNASTDPHWCDWEPFVGEDSNTLLGFLDSSYLFSYSVAMFFSGMVADRMNLRYFLTFGMLLSSLFTVAFGLAYFWRIHSLAYFIAIQVVCGAFQASGWPGVVTIMGNWNGKGKRGLIFGIWNSHTSVGNILGSLMASAFVDTQWGLSFVGPGAFLAAVAIVNFLFLTPYPSRVGCDPPSQAYGSLESHVAGVAASADELDIFIDRDGRSDDSSAESDTSAAGQAVPKLPADRQSTEQAAIGFFRAIRIPGVLPFSICLFFAKLVSYTFLYWLPRFLHSAAKYSPSESANLSTLFDMGGIIGGIMAGLANDWTGAPGIVCVFLLLVAIPVMFVYQAVATVNHTLNMLLLVVVGTLVNGPYALITTAVSADLGTSLRDNARALATVTAIIDGTGSVGAALGPLLAGAASSGGNWTGVFVILMFSDAIAIASLGWVIKREVGDILLRRQQRNSAGAATDSA